MKISSLQKLPEEDSYTSGEYSEFFAIRRQLIDSKKKVAVEKTKFKFLNSTYEKFKALAQDSYGQIDEKKFEKLSKDLKEFKEAKKLYLREGDYQMVDYIDAQIIDIKKIIDDTKNGTSELLSRETIQSLLSKALEEKEESLTNLNTAKTNYKQTQEDFRKSEDKLATIPALRNQLNKLLIERKQSRKV